MTDRLNQGPFPQYAPDAAIPSDEVVMTATPTDEVATPVIKSRRFILESLLLKAGVPACIAGGDRFPFYTVTQVNTSSRKQKRFVDNQCGHALAACNRAQTRSVNGD